MTAVRDPYLDLPLDGVRLIEASAGTGKTYTLATLVTRLVVERGLRIGQVLAVTFTEAATQELRKRIRERLQLTLALIDAPATENASPEVALTKQLLDAHRARGGESDGALRRRLRHLPAYRQSAAGPRSRPVLTLRFWPRLSATRPCAVRLSCLEAL